MNEYTWVEQFQAVYEKAVTQYRAGQRGAESFFTSDEIAFLAGIGHTAQELYDFAEDAVKYGEPTFGTALLIAAVRRDYFLVIQKATPSGKIIRMEDLPPKEAAVAGFAWLPRIIAKAHAKLCGEMPPDLMYGCGGDRNFLQSVRIHPADFLRHVWAAGEDEARIIALVRQAAAPSGK
jgi:hypothetical protein